MMVMVVMMVIKAPRLAPQRLYLGFSRLGPTLSGVDIIKSIFEIFGNFFLCFSG